MKKLGQFTVKSPSLVIRSVLVATLISLATFAPTAVLADPPATKASCKGIKAAYPILGTKCTKQYRKIEHAPANAQEQLKSYKARVAVLEIFQKALLCNGMYGANSSAQNAFKRGEEGHLTALDNLHIAMGNPNNPAAYTKNKLKSVKIKKKQCK